MKNLEVGHRMGPYFEVWGYNEETDNWYPMRDSHWPVKAYALRAMDLHHRLGRRAIVVTLERKVVEIDVQ